MEIFFAGSQSPESNVYMLSNHLNRLLSYANDRTLINKWFEQAKEYDWKGKFFLDSGAFSALTRGVTIDIYKYIDFVNQYGDKFYCYANLDVIPDEKSKKSVLECCEEGFNNFLIIQKHSKYPEKCCAVFHQGEPLSVLHKYIDYYKEHPELKYFCFGGVAGGVGDGVFYFLEKMCRIFRKELPNVKIHLLGYTKIAKLKHLPCDTVDSTTWIMAGANGRVMSPYGSLVVSENLKTFPDSIYHLPEEAFNKTKKFIEDRGFTLEGLSKDYKQRCIYNIAYLQEAVKNVKYVPIMRKKSLI